MQAIAYQLKYCQRCGALRLCPAGSAEKLLPTVRTGAVQLGFAG
jgi:hypothetical protein